MIILFNFEIGINTSNLGNENLENYTIETKKKVQSIFYFDFENGYSALLIIVRSMILIIKIAVCNGSNPL